MRSESRRVPVDAENALDVTSFAPSVSYSSAKQASVGHSETASTILLSEIADYGAMVAEIGATLDLSSAQLAAAEALERVETTFSLPVEQVAGWNDRRVAAWFTALSDDLQIDLRLSGVDSQTTAVSVMLRTGRNPVRKLHDFVAYTESAARTQGNELVIEVRLSIAKGRAVAAAGALISRRPEYFGTPEILERTKVIVFYHSEAWQRFLSPHALIDWETLGLVREDGRAFIVLCDAMGYLAGFALDVVGARLLDEPRWLSVSRSAWRQFQDRSQEVLRLRAEESLWADAPRVLTSAHLRVAERQPGLQVTLKRLRELRATLSALYLASTILSEQGHLTLRFAGSRPATCQLALSQGDTSVSSVETTCEDTALARLCDWAYDNVSSDKLAIVRECLAQELGSGTDLTLRDLEGVAESVFDVARANFVLYLRSNTEQYFRVRQQALEAVSDYAAGVRKAVADLTGDVVDNVYRTVGLLVGVVIAALLQPSLSLDVQRLAACLYTLYIVFVIVFTLEARWRHFTLASADLDVRLTAMSELSASELGRLRTQARGNDAYFRRYFRWSRFIYLGLGAVGLIYFLLLLTPLAGYLLLTEHRDVVLPVLIGRS